MAEHRAKRNRFRVVAPYVVGAIVIIALAYSFYPIQPAKQGGGTNQTIVNETGNVTFSLADYENSSGKKFASQARIAGESDKDALLFEHQGHGFLMDLSAKGEAGLSYSTYSLANQFGESPAVDLVKNVDRLAFPQGCENRLDYCLETGNFHRAECDRIAGESGCYSNASASNVRNTTMHSTFFEYDRPTQPGCYVTKIEVLIGKGFNRVVELSEECSD
ncbi:hypothetical protein HYS54_01255 [Candidatus Micrarchaeota archaeon]|nr:hypothetical protein [Candidatus Micrarchaeota archaeon]